jgi:hypothetical protein
MVTATNSRWEAIERWSPTLFIAAGGAWIIDTAPYALELFIQVSVPEALNGALILVAFLLTLTGTLGLYPPLAEETPTLAFAGVLLITFAGLVILGTFAWVIGAGLLGLSMPPVASLIMIIALNLLALFIFGFASLRFDVPSRACGVLLIALAATWTVWIAGITGLLSSAPEWASAVLGILFAAISMAIGAVLHVDGFPLRRHTSSSSLSIE